MRKALRYFAELCGTDFSSPLVAAIGIGTIGITAIDAASTKAAPGVDITEGGASITCVGVSGGSGGIRGFARPNALAVEPGGTTIPPTPAALVLEGGGFSPPSGFCVITFKARLMFGRREGTLEHTKWRRAMMLLVVAEVKGLHAQMPCGRTRRRNSHATVGRGWEEAHRDVRVADGRHRVWIQERVVRHQGQTLGSSGSGGREIERPLASKPVAQGGRVVLGFHHLEIHDWRLAG